MIALIGQVRVCPYYYVVHVCIYIDRLFYIYMYVYEYEQTTSLLYPYVHIYICIYIHNPGPSVLVVGNEGSGLSDAVRTELSAGAIKGGRIPLAGAWVAGVWTCLCERMHLIHAISMNLDVQVRSRALTRAPPAPSFWPRPRGSGGGSQESDNLILIQIIERN